MIKKSLTAAQLGIWLGQAKHAGSVRYNTAEYIELNTAVNAELFLLAAARVLQETSSLNVSFEQNQGLPVQSMLNAVERTAKHGDYLDLSNQSEPIIAAEQFLAQWQMHPYDLSKGDLYRHILIRINSNKFLWALGAHHIALDGFSFSLITNRVLNAYEGNEVGSDIAQYEALIDEDIKYKNSNAYHKDENYWTEELSFFGNAVTLTQQPLNGNAEKLKVTAFIDKSQLKSLDTLAKEKNSNWSELLFTAVSYLTYQQTGVEKTIIGMPVANRIASKAANTPCMHMNIVPIKVLFSECVDFAELLVQVSKRLQKARRHFRFRYENLRAKSNEGLIPKRLFGPVVNILPFERNTTCEGSRVVNHPLSAGPVEDIAFIFIMQSNGSVRFEIEANQSGYSCEDLIRLQKAFITLLDDLTSQLSQPLKVTRSDFALCSIQKAPDKRNVLESLFAQAKASSSKIALQNIEGESLSYGQLVEKVSHLASKLIQITKRSDSCILLALPRSQNTIIAMWAVLLAECRFVFIDIDAPLSRNRMIIEDASPELVLVDASSAHLTIFDELNITKVSVDSALIEVREGDIHLPTKLADSKQAYLIYTSGSTGKPKGVQISQGALSGFVNGAKTAYGISQDDRVLQFAPFHFDTCIEEVFVTQTLGATLILRNDEMLNSFECFISEVERLQITVLDLPTAYWHELCHFVCETKTTMPASVHTIIIGGEAVNRKRVESWCQLFSNSIRLLNTYGPTEATVVATFTDLSTNTNTSLIGHPLPGRETLVVREPRQLAKFGERGELWLSGTGLASGYLGLDKQNEAAFVKFWHPIKQHYIDAYRTGDVVRMLPDGQLEYIGRADSQLKISGYRIEIGEIEAVLLGLKGIQEAAVTIIKDLTGKPKGLCAHIVSEYEWNLATLREALALSLPSAMLPGQYHNHSSLPKTPANKVDRKQLEGFQSYEMLNGSLTELEQSIAAVWQEVLGIEVQNAEDNFFNIGGQSLQCIQVAARLSQLFNKQVSVAFLFAHPTLKELSLALEGNTENQQQGSNSVAAQLDKDLLEFKEALQSVTPIKMSSRSVNTVLLTGATGFVGAQILKSLLLQPGLKIVCVVRANDIAHAKARLQSAFQAQKIGSIDFSSVEFLLTDIAKPLLGLDEQAYNLLGHQVTQVLHNAAHTSVLRDYKSLKTANVTTTSQLLMFAKKFSVSFNQVSTIAVAPTDGAPLAEEFVARHSGLNDGYQQSKWLSEAMVETAIQQGITSKIYRLARVTGSLRSGYINQNDLVWRILRTGLKHLKLPQLAVFEPWTPVDKVAKFVADQTLYGTQNSVFNVTPDTLVPLSQLYSWLQEYGFAFEIVPLDDWLKTIEQSSDEDDLAIASFFRAQSQKSHEPMKLEAFNQNFKSASRSSETRLESLTKSDLAIYLDYAFDSGLINVTSHLVAFQNIKKLIAFLKLEKELS